MLSSRDRGQAQEQRARTYLERQGLRHLQSNYHCRLGEIDLIMVEAETLCFIEVRYRKNAHFGGASASVTHSKQQKLIQTAQHFLQHHPKLQQLPARFDVVSLEGKREAPKIDWIKNAFCL